MPHLSQVRGVMLEEALLFLLRQSGYRVIVDRGDDPSLGVSSAGLLVYGRGGEHQIDAVADYVVAQPFSNPQRLLVEAKCYSDDYPVGLPLLRGAVGVLKDVNESWFPLRRGGNNLGGPSKKRYHYQFAYFSASGYTKEAEKYAFAHDVFLIPLAKSAFFQPLLSAIRAITHLDLGGPSVRSVPVDLTALRAFLRYELLHIGGDGFYIRDDWRVFDGYLFACRQVGAAYIGSIGRSLPIFLVPSNENVIETLSASQYVEIWWDDRQHWYIRSSQTRQNLFSFEMPQHIFSLYAESGVLSQDRAIQLKSSEMGEIQVMVTNKGLPTLITFHLDRDWLRDVEVRLRNHA